MHVNDRQSTYFLRPHSPVVFRSGRPFGATDAGGGGTGYGFPLPSTVAGVLRGAWVDGAKHEVAPSDQTLLMLEVEGGLRAVRRQGVASAAVELYAPQPADAVYRAHNGRRGWTLDALNPLPVAPSDGGTDLGHGLWPVAVSSRYKPVSGPADWSLPALAKWMARDLSELQPQQAREALATARRPHVVIDSETLAAVDGGLFESAGLSFGDLDHDEGVLAWLGSRDAAVDTRLAAGRHIRFGADGPTATVELLDPAGADPRACPGALARQLDALDVGDCFRLLLLTPGCFLRNGWYPDGLAPVRGGNGIEGSIVSLLPSGDMRRRTGAAMADPARWHLRLRAAALGPWVPMAASKLRASDGAPGFTRRPLRRLVPAGAVYWLEIARRGERPLSHAWMQPLCRTEYARDGFGVALLGLSPR
jgi:CRISPR-associated protein Cmr3